MSEERGGADRLGDAGHVEEGFTGHGGSGLPVRGPGGAEEQLFFRSADHDDAAVDQPLRQLLFQKR